MNRDEAKGFEGSLSGRNLHQAVQRLEALVREYTDGGRSELLDK